MIYSMLHGRCGNQLFCYAFARKIQSISGDDIVFNSSYVTSYKGAVYSVDLGKFNLQSYVLDDDGTQPLLKYGNIFQKYIFSFYYKSLSRIEKSTIQFYKKQEKWQPVLNIFGIYNISHGYSKVRKSIFKNKFIDGSWENSAWFDEIRNQLLSEIQPKTIKAENIDLFNLINTTESVCISIRRGDFMSKENIDERFICNEEYYKKAIKKIEELVYQPVYFVFSDEIEWVKNNMSFSGRVYYEDGNDSVEQNLWLMSSCKHFVLANSTFSWWAQYLSQNEKKIVVSPDHWLNNEFGYRHPLMNKSFIKIST